MLKITGVLVAFVVMSAIKVNALKCYKCDSSENALCNYGFYGLTELSYNTVSCPDGGLFNSLIPKRCVKIVAKDHYDREYVARDCIVTVGPLCSATVKALNVFQTVGNIKDIDCYTCDEDKCNSAMNLNGHGSKLVFLVLSVSILKLFVL